MSSKNYFLNYDSWYTTTTSSGTSALELAFKLLNQEKMDMSVPDLTFEQL